MTATFEFADLVFNYGGVRAIDDASGRIEAGEVVGFIGPNGAGKSTLFNLLAGRLKPSRGLIRFKGDDVTRTGEVSRVKHGISRIPQHALVFGDLSVAVNIAVGGYRRGRKCAVDVDKIMHSLHLWHLRDSLANDLTFSEQRRLSIGIALSAAPEVLLIDEPGAGLTSLEKEDLGSTLRTLANEGRAIGFIDHDIVWVASLIDRGYVLVNGSTFMDGTPQAILNDERVINSYLGAEVMG